MFLDLNAGDNWGEPVCKSCNRTIDRAEPTEVLEFDHYEEPRFEGMNGVYHVECAKPFHTVLRALDALRRFSH